MDAPIFPKSGVVSVAEPCPGGVDPSRDVVGDASQAAIDDIEPGEAMSLCSVGAFFAAEFAIDLGEEMTVYIKQFHAGKCIVFPTEESGTFTVSNAAVGGNTLGVSFRMSRNLYDRHPGEEMLLWGEQAHGTLIDGWLEMKRAFPIKVDVWTDVWSIDDLGSAKEYVWSVDSPRLAPLSWSVDSVATNSVATRGSANDLAIWLAADIWSLDAALADDDAVDDDEFDHVSPHCICAMGMFSQCLTRRGVCRGV